MKDNEVKARAKLLLPAEAVEADSNGRQVEESQLKNEDDGDLFFDRVPPLSPTLPMTPLTNFIAEANFLAPEILQIRSDAQKLKILQEEDIEVLDHRNHSTYAC